MAFTSLSRNPNPLFQHILGLFYEQAVEIDGVARDCALGVVFPENVVARLTVVLVHLCGVGFAFFGKLVGARSIAGFVGLVGFVEAGGAFGGFLARKIAETVVLGFGIGGRVV